MGKTIEVAENLVKMANTLRYDDHDAKDKVIQFAEKFISDEFGETSVYLQKLRLIVFSPKESAVFSGMGAGEDNLKRSVFEGGLEKLIALLKEVFSEVGGKVNTKVLVIQSRDIMTSKRVSAYIKSKGYAAETITDEDDWRSEIDRLFS